MVTTNNHKEQVKSDPDDAVDMADVIMMDVTASAPEDAEDINELAKQVKEEASDSATAGFDGTTATVGRGLSNVISMLQQTGEIASKRSGREELRGRAKDKRHYEDYEPLNLASVVRIDKAHATDKDKDLANREIKLEYRDKHGRLLTRKEAYRDLCYQFHGHGSSKKREDKRMKQISMEQSEARLASRQVALEKGSGTTLGALKATQEATGKAFVVHKT
jgi:U4/U6.U5 tri-snRNP-associated protein 1